MGFVRTLTRAAILWGKENALDLLSAVVLPGTSRVVTRTLGREASRWATSNLWAARTVDGGILGGVRPPEAGAKYTLPKGLPKAGERHLVIENGPHTLEGFNGVIESGYGKGRKSLLFTGRIPVKVGAQTSLRRVEYHVHDADVAGLHYDLAVAGLPPGTEQFELNIPNGDFKGRYAIVKTAKGFLSLMLKDEGPVIEKPSYSLKPAAFLDQVRLDNANGERWIVEQKEDGSLGNFKIGKGKAVFHSHREGGQTYYDRIPALEDLHNTSRYWSSRKLMPYPDLDGTVGKVELVHPDGVHRVAGILNALPGRAQDVQLQRGPVQAHCWDLVKYKGRDVSGLPYAQRRALAEKVVREIRFYNRNWDMVQKMDAGDDPVAFYNSIVRLPLPFGEGVVIKDAGDPTGETWFKVKQVDFADLVLVEVLPGSGKYADSVGKLVVQNPANGAIGEVGSFAIPDQQREWIWNHRELVQGSTVKIQVQELTARGAPRAGVFMGFHEGKGNTEAGLYMYAESLAGGDQEEMMRTKYALIAAQGWRR
jgi:hypothetical protein